MAALGLLFMIVVVTAIVCRRARVWLSTFTKMRRLKTISPNLPNQRYRQRQATGG